MVYELTSAKLQKCINVFSKQKSVDPKDVQILILKQQGDLSYRMCVNYNPIEQITLKKILNLIVDILDMEKHTKKFLEDSHLEFSKQIDATEEETFIFVCNSKEDLEMLCFKNSQYKGMLSLKEHFLKKGII